MGRYSDTSGQRVTRNSLNAINNYFWVGLMVVSFAYDEPFTNVFGVLRLEPRPFDIVMLLYLLRVLLDKQELGHRRSMSWYLKTPLTMFVLWISMIVALQAFWMDMEYERYSVYFLLRYFQLLAALWLISTARLTERQRINTLYLYLLTCIFVTVVGIVQYLGIVSYFRLTPRGVVDYTGWGLMGKEVRISSTLGVHYAYFGQYSVLGVAIALLATWVQGKNQWQKLLTWGGLVSGLAGVVVSQALSAFVSLATMLLLSLGLWWFGGRRNVWIVFVVILVVTGLAVTWQSLPENVVARFERMWDQMQNPDTIYSASESPIDRLQVGSDYFEVLLNTNDFGDWVAGRGFYVARGAGNYRRIGYGVHNIILFPLEQAGILGFLLGLWVLIAFVFRPFRQFWDTHRSPFARASGRMMVAWAVAVVVAGQGGQIFWYFEAFGNWFVVCLSMWSLLVFPFQQERGAGKRSLANSTTAYSRATGSKREGSSVARR